MKKLLAKIRKILHDRRTRQMLTRIVSVTAAIVVFITTYALVLPAITMESEANCGIEAHQHDESCYEDQLICGEIESPGHHHSEACYEVSKALVCEEQEHQHDDSCFDESGNLTCDQPEHTHDDTCYKESRELTCDIPESDGHQHSSACYERVLTCGKEIHTHSTACYEQASDTAASASADFAAVATTELGSSGATVSASTEIETESGEPDAASSETSDAWTTEKNTEGNTEGGAASSATTNASTTATTTAGSSSTAAAAANTATASTGNTAFDPSAAEDTYIPQLEPVIFEQLLTKDTGIYYYHAEEGEEAPESSADIADWKRVNDDAELTPADLLRVYLRYTIPAGTLNATNDIARYRLPSNLHLTDQQMETINTTVNGVANQYVSLDTLEITDTEKYNTYLGIEATEGTRTPSDDIDKYFKNHPDLEGQEYINAVVRAENVFDDTTGEYAGQDLVFTFSPYTVQKNQHEYDADGQPTKAGQKVDGWLCFDLHMDQIDWSEPVISTIDDSAESIQDNATPTQDESVETAEGSGSSDATEATEITDSETEEETSSSSSDPDALNTNTITEKKESSAEIIFSAKDKALKIDEISTELHLVEVNTIEKENDVAQDDHVQSADDFTDEDQPESEIEVNAETYPEVSFEDTITVQAGTLTTDNETAAQDTPAETAITVSVIAEEETFPLGTTMQLGTVEDMDTVASAVEGAVEGQTRGFHAVDISFHNADGEEIEPLKPIKVNMTSDAIKQAVEDASMAPVVVHVEDSAGLPANSTDAEENSVNIKLQSDREAEKSENTPIATIVETNEASAINGTSESTETADTLSFDAGSFSVYAIVYTVDFEYSVNGKMYQFSLPGGGFVSFTDLVEVLGIIGDTNSWENGDENGSKIAEITEENTTNGEAEENGINSDTNTLMTLGDVEVSEATRKFVADVASVEFSSPELVDVSKVENETTIGQIKESRGLECEYSADLKEDQIAEIDAQTVEAGDWALISMLPFTSEEQLTVTMKDGEVFTIRVTDAQIKKTVIDAKGDTWEITVTYDDSAEIPDGAELKVREILPEDEEYDQYYQQSLEKVGVNAPEKDTSEEDSEEVATDVIKDAVEEVTDLNVSDGNEEESEEHAKKAVSDYAHIFDIEIWADDHKVEPAADVTVNIKLLDAPEDTEATPQVVHFAEDGAELMDLKDKGEEDVGIQFVTDEFSVYSVVYTVDFSYEVNGKVYGFTMNGEDSVSLRALIEALHVYEKAADEEDSDGEANEVEASVTSEDLTDNEAELEGIDSNLALNDFMADIKSVEFTDPERLAVCEVKEDTTLGQLNIANGIVQKYTLTAPEPELKKYNAKVFKAGDWALISLKPFDTEESLKIRLTTGEEFTIKVTDAQDAQMVGDQVLTVSNPAGTTIDLFDYWINDDLKDTVGRYAWPGGFDGNGWTNDWEYQDIGLLVEGQGTEAGINEGHAFKFTPAYAGTVRDGTTNYRTKDASGRVNSYMGDGNTWNWNCPNPNQGIVQNKLSGGYPILTEDTVKGTNGESLAYLFDPTISHQGKESYSGVDQFLYVDKDGYYKYDSRDYKADYNYDGTFTLTEQTAAEDSSDRGFWPFGTSKFWSGMHINAQFSMPENGQVLNPRGEDRDMQFEFSGDDDTWIYVDGVLIGDGGGIHNRCEIDINFANGNVIINGVVVGTLKEMIESAKRAEIDAMTPEEREKWDAQWNGNTFAAGTYHTFDMFYLERGGDQSNLYIKYNLVSTADFTAHKSYSGYDDDDVMQRNQFRFELIGLAGKYRSVENGAGGYDLVQDNPNSPAIMPHASGTGAGTTVSPYYNGSTTTVMSNGSIVGSQTYITGNVEDGNVNFGNAEISEQDMHDCDAGNPPVYRYIVREVVPDDAVNADNVTWAEATPEQRAAGGFVKDSVVYDNTVYYMTARVTSWTETDAGGTPRTRYGLSKTYYTDDTYTTKKENTPFIDFRNTYQPDLADYEFDKVDANEEPVGGAVFQLFRDSACKIPAKDSNNQFITATSISNGKVSFEKVRTGIYFMKEVTAPEPYDLNPTVYRVTISKQGSHMCVNSDQNNTPVTVVYNLKSTDITVMKKWVNQDGEEVNGAGHPATVQLRRYRYVSTAPASETHNVTLHFHFPDAGWNTPNKDFGPYTVTGNSVNIHWNVGGCGFFWDGSYTQSIATGDCLLQMPLTGDIELDIYGNQDWASNNLNNVSVDGAVDDSKELRLDDTFPSEAEKAKATQELTADHPMHAWSFGIGDAFDFPPGDELGQYLYYVVELNDQGEDVAIGGNVDEDMKLLFIEYNPAMTDGKGITHGLITVTNEVTVAQPTTVDITILKVDNDNNSIKLGGATFELTKVQSLETSNQVSDDGYSERGTTSDADDETKGKLLFTGLTPGYYYLHETKSPDGYVITTNGWHFQVDENGIVSGVGDFDPDGFFRYVDENNITVTNQKGAALPNTGGPGTRLFAILGSILILGAGLLLWRRRRLI